MIKDIIKPNKFKISSQTIKCKDNSNINNYYSQIA